MNPLQLLLDLISRARKIIEFNLKASVDTSTENYFVPIQMTGEEVQRIGLANMPVSDPVKAFVNSLVASISASEKFTFNVTTDQTTFNITTPFNSVDVTLDRTRMIEGVDYNVTANNVVFTNTVSNGSIVEVRIFTTTDSAITSKQSFTATAGQTVIDVGQSFASVEVVLNRTPMIDTVDFNDVANTIVFTNPLQLNDIVTIRTFGS